MTRILVPTDFSTRSDRAIRRATLIARSRPATLVLLHVVDDDRPARLVEAERREADALLSAVARTLEEVDGIVCEARLAFGQPPDMIAAEADTAELVVLGPYRRTLLRDVFVGTTAERTIRRSRRPVLMANAVPAGPYGRVVAACDLSEGAAAAASAARRLGLLDGADLIGLRAIDIPGTGAISRAAVAEPALKAYLAEQERQAREPLAGLLDALGHRPARAIVAPVEGTVAATILARARAEAADLIVVGTRPAERWDRRLLGSVAEAVLRDAEIDVLAVPPASGFGAGPSGAAGLSG